MFYYTIFIILFLLLFTFIIYSIKHPLWKQHWFSVTVNWLNDHWPWWKQYIYGKSINLEDFVRNPAEILRDTCFPFVINDVKAISLIILRVVYKYFQSDLVNEYIEEGKKDKVVIYPGTYWNVPMGEKRKWIIKKEKWALWDIRIWNQFWTKFCNCFLFLQIVLSIKWFIPIPYIAFNLRFSKESYFQFGFGYSPQFKEGSSTEYNTILTAKFRIASHKEEATWNPGDVYGFWEGTI